MSSLIQNLSGLAPQGYYEEELKRIRDRRRGVGFGDRENSILWADPDSPREDESWPALPDDGQNWKYDENNQPTLNPGVGDESYRNIHIDYAPGTNVSPERYRQDQKAAEDRFRNIFGKTDDDYGSRVGVDLPPNTGFTMDWRDGDGDGIDDRHQRGPGQPDEGPFQRDGGTSKDDWRQLPGPPPSDREDYSGDFERGDGISTQALVKWIHPDGRVHWAPDGGYSPKPGSGWQREGMGTGWDGWDPTDSRLPEDSAGGWDDEEYDRMPPGWGGSGTPPLPNESMEDYQRRMREIQDRWDNQRREEREGRRPPRRRGKDTWGPGEEMPPVRPGLPRPPEDEIQPYPMPGPRPEIPPIHGDPIGPERPREEWEDRQPIGDLPGEGWTPGKPIQGIPGRPPSNDTVIESFYRNVLGRESDAEGKAYWMDRARDGMSLADIEKSFQQSPEALKNKVDKVRPPRRIDPRTPRPPRRPDFDGPILVPFSEQGQPHSSGSGTRREASIEPAVKYPRGQEPSQEDHARNIQELRDTEDSWRGPLERYGRRRNEVEDTLQTSTPQTPEREKRAAKKRAEVQRERSAERAAQESVGRSRRESITRPQPRTQPAPSRPTPAPKSDWLEQAYQSNLGRSADAGGKAYWAKEVASGRQTKDQVIANIRRSDEYKNRNR